MLIEPALAAETYCYLTTTGRSSGHPHTIEIWFGVEGDTVYMLSGGRESSDWVRNLMRTPDVLLRIGSTTFRGNARVIEADTAEDANARRMLVEKYAPGYSRDLTNWGETALPIAVDVSAIASTDAGAAMWPKGRRRG